MFECWIHMLSTKPLPLLFYSLVSWRLGILFGEIFKIKMVHFSFDTFLIIAQFQDSWPATSLKYTPKTRPHLNVLFIHLFIHLFIYLLCIYLFFIYLFYLFIYLFSLQGCSDRVPGDGDGVAENEDTLVTGGWVGIMWTVHSSTWTPRKQTTMKWINYTGGQI